MSTHPSYDPTAGHATVQDAADAIDMSIHENRIVHLDYTTALAAELAQECEDSVEVPQGDGDHDWIEYWGRDIDGNEWRVHLTH
jgi:hypothetical protein